MICDVMCGDCTELIDECVKKIIGGGADTSDSHRSSF